VIAARRKTRVTKDKPTLGDFGTLIVKTILPGFCEKRIFRRPRLTWGKYLGAYQVVASEAVLLGLRFRHAPLSMIKLICKEGTESDLTEFLRSKALEIATEFDRQEVSFDDVAMYREHKRLLDRNLPDSQEAEAYEHGAGLLTTWKTVIDIKAAVPNLATCFALFLALGLFESDWIKQVYLRFMPGDDRLQKDTRRLEELVKGWVSEVQPSLLGELFPLSVSPR
jgi:hypothetical protein